MHLFLPIASATVVASSIVSATVVASSIVSATVVASSIVSATVVASSIVSATVVASSIVSATVVASSIVSATVVASSEELSSSDNKSSSSAPKERGCLLFCVSLSNVCKVKGKHHYFAHNFRRLGEFW